MFECGEWSREGEMEMEGWRDFEMNMGKEERAGDVVRGFQGSTW
jgi:hypothetical protein